MRLSTVLLVALLPACGFSSNSDSAGGDGGGGGSDGHGQPPDATQCFGSYVRVCFDTAADIPTTPLTLTSDIDTDTSQLCNTHNDRDDKACVVVAAGLTVASGTTIRGTGTKPLILLSTTTADLSGTVDVSSSHLGTIGAGAVSIADCAGTTAASNNSGGFGGSFGGRGGEGAAVDVGGQNPRGGLPALALSSFPMKLRGGCPGGAGSTDAGGVTPAAGGAGGGAVLIIAQSIQISGRINASGAGGAGGPSAKAGGGGGGAGGMIVLDAAMLTGDGVLFANGGGGGQGGTGGGGAGSGAGDPGQESPGPMMSAAGGQSAGKLGGKGGAGSAGINNDGDSALVPANSQAGGGGGGGGAGFIHAPGLTPVNIAPASKDL